MKKHTMPVVTSLKQIAAGRSDIFKLSAANLTFLPGFNERQDMGDLEPLVAAAERGQLPPLLVRVLDGKVVVIDGERRTRAAHIAIERGLAVPPLACQYEPKDFTEADRTLCLLERNAGKPLTLLEEARVIARLVTDHQLDHKSIKARTGRSRTHIKNCLALLEVPEDILASVAKGKITASLVIDLITETKDAADPTAALVEKVTAAISTAADKGKSHASRKDLPSSSNGRDGSPQPSDSSSAPQTSSSQPSTTNPQPLSGIEAIKAADSSPAPGSGLAAGYTGEGGTADAKVKKLNKMMEGLDREKCVGEFYDLLEYVIDYLDNKRPLAEVKKKILLPSS